jgi:hypothetical protein
MPSSLVTGLLVNAKGFLVLWKEADTSGDLEIVRNALGYRRLRKPTLVHMGTIDCRSARNRWDALQGEPMVDTEKIAIKEVRYNVLRAECHGMKPFDDDPYDFAFGFGLPCKIHCVEQSIHMRQQWHDRVFTAAERLVLRSRQKLSRRLHEWELLENRVGVRLSSIGDLIQEVKKQVVWFPAEWGRECISIKPQLLHSLQDSGPEDRYIVTWPDCESTYFTSHEGFGEVLVIGRGSGK